MELDTFLIEQARLNATSRLSRPKITHEIFSFQASLDGMRFKFSTFSNMEIVGNDVKFSNCHFEDCIIAITGDFYRCTFSNCTFCDVSKSQIRNCTITECNLSGAVFDKSTCYCTSFILSDTPDVSFRGADLTRCSFVPKTALSRADMVDAISTMLTLTNNQFARD